LKLISCEFRLTGVCITVKGILVGLELVAVGCDIRVHGEVLKLEMNVGTWCMDRSIVTGPFPFRNSATGK
jgi:hypothetical protein